MATIYTDESIGTYPTPIPDLSIVPDGVESKIRKEGGTAAVKNGDAICVGYVEDGEDSFLALPGTKTEAEDYEVALWNMETDQVSKFQWVAIWPKFYPGSIILSTAELAELTATE